MLHRSLILLFLLFSVGCGGPAFNHKDESPTDNSQQDKKREKKPGDNSGGEFDCSGQLLDFTSVEEDVCMEWVAGPLLGGESSFRITFDGDGDLPSIEAKIWMPDHGHGSRPLEIVAEENGYLVKEVHFIMPGAWDVHIVVNGEEKVIRVDL